MKASISELLQLYRSGTRTPSDVLDEIYAELPASRSKNVFISTFPRAAVEQQLAGKDPASPLYGVPFSVKDNIDVRGLPTTAACPSYSYLPSANALVVERLCQAGAVVIGKTNMDQFATGLVGTRSPYGACSSVFNPAFISGGSSSGSAVSVARGLSAFSLGTDTAGSGRVPAAFNALVGLKPSRGLLSTRGVVPACRSLDCVSIFSHTVQDSRLLFEICAEFDPEDSVARRASASVGLDDGVVRVGVPRPQDLEFFGDQESAQLFEKACDRALALGWEIERFDLGPFLEAARLLYTGPWVAERLALLEPFLEQGTVDVDPNVRQILLAGASYSAADAFRAQYRLRDLQRQVAPVLASYDALLLPTTPTHYSIAEIEAEPILLNSRLGTYTNFVNLLDLSALAVPAGFRANGLPFGITLMGPAFADGRLLELGARFVNEAAFPLQRRPNTVWLAVAGAHLSGQPLNHELTLRGGRRIRTCATAPEYRLFALNTSPKKPGLVHAPGERAQAIEVEVWELTEEAFGSFVAAVPAPMAIGTTILSDGSRVKGFTCEPYALEGAREISEFGSWRAYLGS